MYLKLKCGKITRNAPVWDGMSMDPSGIPTMKSLKTGSEGEGARSEAAEETAAAVNVNDPKMPLFDTKAPDYDHLNIEPLFEDLVDFETFSKSDFRAVKVLTCEAVPKSKKLLKFTLDDGSGVKRTILSGIHAYYEPEEHQTYTILCRLFCKGQKSSMRRLQKTEK